MRKIYHTAMSPHRNTVQTHHKTTKLYKSNGKSGSHFICCFSPKQTTKHPSSTVGFFFFFSFSFSSLVFITNWCSFALISCCFAVRFATVPWHIWVTLSFSLKIRQLHVVPFRELIPQYAVRKVNYAIHLIYLHPMDIAIDFPSTYPLDSDLSDGERYPTFEQPRSITISVKNSLILKTSQISNYAVALTRK